MNHVARVRAYLREHAADDYAIDPIDSYRQGSAHPVRLTVADLDALCRDAERLAEVEDL